MANRRRAAMGGAVAVLSIALAGCSAMPDWMPFSGSEESERAPGAEQRYPSLSTVPAKPAIVTGEQERAEVAKELVADREAARYADSTIRSGGEAAPPPPAEDAGTDPGRRPVIVESSDRRKQAVAAAETGSDENGDAQNGDIGRAAPKPPPAPPAPTSTTTTTTTTGQGIAPAAPPRPAIPAKPRIDAPSGPTKPDTAMQPMREPPNAAAAAPTQGPVPDQASVPDQPSNAPRQTSQISGVTFGPPPSDIAIVQSGRAAAPDMPAGPAGPVMGGPPRLAGTILFDNGASRVDERARALLRDIAAQWGQNQRGNIRVIGHSSSRTRDMAPLRHHLVNFNLSHRRAEAVARTLAGLGVPAERIRISAMSDAAPVFYEVMPAGEAGNRRAEIYFEN